jgi:hypothetical protein
VSSKTPPLLPLAYGQVLTDTLSNYTRVNELLKVNR